MVPSLSRSQLLVITGIALLTLPLAIIGKDLLTANSPSRHISSRPLGVALDSLSIVPLFPGTPKESAKRGVLFVFQEECSICNENMHNWVDLMLAADSGRSIAFIALGTPRSRYTAVDYWRPYLGKLHLLGLAEPENLVRLEITGSPATGLVENGIVKSIFAGPLNRYEMDVIFNFIHGAK